MAQIIDGKAVAAEIRSEVKTGVEAFTSAHGRSPRLEVVLVGTDPASLVYVKNKQKACEKAGIRTETISLPGDTTEEALLEVIGGLNADNDVNGILVQLPLPEHINAYRITSSIAPGKDVDGLTPENAGLLVHNAARLKPCTPLGCIELLKRSEISLSGKSVVIIGRSKLVGLPLFNLLTNENCTVTVCHSKTPSIEAYTRNADIVIVAVGKPCLLKGDMIKPGSVVVDVGINRADDGRLVGDADFESVSRTAAFVTPVPGGVGPMTIAMLLKNTLTAAEDMYV